MEKRKTQRRHFIYYLKVLDNKNNLFGHIIDLSESGIQIVSEKEYRAGKEYELFINIPKELDVNDKNRLHFKAQVRWIKSDPNIEYYDIGLEITEKINFNPDVIYALFEEIGFTN